MEGGIEVKCTDCGSRNIDEDSVRERSCMDCGLVLSENHIDPGQEWSEFGVEDRVKQGLDLPLLSFGMTRDSRLK